MPENPLKDELSEEKTVNFSFIKVIIFILVLAFAAVAIFAIYFFGNKSTGAQISAISKELNKQYDARFKNQETQIEKYRQDLQLQAELGSYDRIRMGDATNILLALQNYSFEKNNLPANLKELSQGNYYDGNFNDPESGTEYYYKKLDAENYILCIYLSSGTWGTNKSQCPTSPTSEADSGKP
ncbi:MAG: hypothetical protein WCX69_02390 [Candidatus Paceibacterota bacterium]